MNAYSEVLEQYSRTQSYEDKKEVTKQYMSVSKVDIPTEPGWYFCLQPFQEQICYIQSGSFNIFASDCKGYDTKLSDSNYFPPESTEWYGPIPFPKRTILK